MRDREIIAVVHYDDHPLGSHRCGAEPYRYAEEIIRCKECKWAEPNREGDYDCKVHIPVFRVTENDFCSHGERRES